MVVRSMNARMPAGSRNIESLTAARRLGKDSGMMLELPDLAHRELQASEGARAAV